MSEGRPSDRPSNRPGHRSGNRSVQRPAGGRSRPVRETAAKDRAGDLPRAFGFLLIPQFAMMGFAAATEPLRAANRLAGRELYSWQVISAEGAPVAASSGIDIVADRSLEDVGRLDALFVVAGLEAHKYQDRQVFARLRRLSLRNWFRERL